MATTNLTTFDAASQRKIASAVRRLLREPRNDPGRDRQWPGYANRGEQFGVTATCAEFPMYPLESAAPNTYVVKLQEWHFTEEPGAQEISKIDWSQYVVARIWNWKADTEYLVEGTSVHVWPVPTRRGIRWWMEAGEFSSPPPPPSDESSSESPPPPSESSSEESSQASSEASSTASSEASSQASSEASSVVSSEASSAVSSEESAAPSSEQSPESSESGCTGSCNWEVELVGEVLTWVLQSNDCAGDASCVCNNVAVCLGEPEYVGQTANAACGYECPT